MDAGMTNKTLVMAVIIGKSIATLAAISGAVYLANAGKDGWGWLIFLAIVLGGFSIKES